MESSTIESESKTMFYQRDLPFKSFQKFGDMRINGELCDVTLTVKDVRVSVHRLILAANIPYFRSLFSSNMAESNQSEILLHEIEPNAFKSLIYFLYSCELEINEENVVSLLITAHYLGMEQVSQECCKFMSKLVNNTNVLEVRKLAAMLDIAQLQEFVSEYVAKNFFEISCSEAFLELPFSDVKELLAKDDIQVSNEQEVYRVVMAWVKRSPANREDKLPELLTTVRMQFVPYSFLATCVASEELIQKSNACLRLLHDAKDNCILPDRPLPCSFASNPRTAKNYLYAVCRINALRTPTVVQRYNFYTGEWQIMEGKTKYVRDAAVVVIRKRVYVIGGSCKFGDLLNSVLVFDTETDSWSEKAPLRQKKMLISATVFSNRIYACGGKHHDVCLNQVDCYYPGMNRWTALPDMLEARCGASCAFLNECLYVLGGYGGAPGSSIVKCLNSVERYCLKSKQWTRVASMDMQLYLRGAASLSGRIYVYGELFIDVYDPQLEEWHRISNMKNSRSGFTLLTFCGKLYAVGGSNSSTVDIYDPETGEWSTGKSFPSNLYFVGAGMVSV